MHATILEAISKRKCLQFYYNGFQRTVEPHTYGKSNRGNNILRAYQTEGESQSGDIPNWRLFTEEEIDGLQLLNKTSQAPRHGYKKGDKAMRNIYIEIN